MRDHLKCISLSIFSKGLCSFEVLLYTVGSLNIQQCINFYRVIIVLYLCPVRATYLSEVSYCKHILVLTFNSFSSWSKGLHLEGETHKGNPHLSAYQNHHIWRHMVLSGQNADEKLSSESCVNTPLNRPCPGISCPVLLWRLKRYTAATIRRNHRRAPTLPINTGSWSRARTSDSSPLSLSDPGGGPICGSETNRSRIIRSEVMITSPL